MHGGRRVGAGRRPGSVNVRTREIAEAALASGITPLEVLLNTMRAAWERSENGTIQGEDLSLALSCAERSAPYIHARIQAVSLDGKLENKVEGRLEVFWGGCGRRLSPGSRRDWVGRSEALGARVREPGDPQCLRRRGASLLGWRTRGRLDFYHVLSTRRRA